jgi:PAS domain S-box-containing protein
MKKRASKKRDSREHDMAEQDNRPPQRTRKKGMPPAPRSRRTQPISTSNTIPSVASSLLTPTRIRPPRKPEGQNADLEPQAIARVEFLHLLQNIAVVTNGLMTSDEVFEFALERICTQIGWCIGQVWLPAKEAVDTLVPSPAWYSQDPERYVSFRRVTEATRLGPGIGLPGRVWATERPLWIPDVTVDSNFPRAQHAVAGGIRGACAFPVLVGKRIVAVMEFFAREVVEPDEPLLEVMAQIGTVLGLVVERQRVETMLRGFFDAAPDAMLMVNHQGDIVLANKQTEQVFGYAGQELQSRPIEILLPKRVRDRHGAHRANYFSAPILRPMGKGLQLTGVRKEKGEFPVEVSLSPLHTEEGLMVIAAVRDVSERKQAEAALRESEERFRQAFDHAATGKALVALNGQWLKVNRALCDLTGYAEHELLATDFQSITHPDDVAADLTTIQRLLANELHAYEMEKRYLHKRGHVVWVLLSVSLVRDAAGAPLYFIAEVQDLTERKRLERQLRERERLAAVGTTVAKVVHEIGNPLNGMASTLQVLERHLGRQPSAPDNLLIEAVQDLKHETSRLHSLLQELHTFAHTRELALRPTNLAAVAAEVLRGAMVYYLEKGIGVEQHLSTEAPLVLADDEKLRQVLLNLYKNAVEAMPQGGTLSLRGTHTETEVSLEVQDTGQGIPEGVEIFAPFVTTKENGAGLGLAIIKQIIEAHGATIAYRSTPGQGTTFRLTFLITTASKQTNT